MYVYIYTYTYLYLSIYLSYLSMNESRNENVYTCRNVQPFGFAGPHWKKRTCVRSNIKCIKNVYYMTCGLKL